MKKVKKVKEEVPDIKRTNGYFNIKILGPDGKVRGKSGMDKTQVFEFYFVGLTKNLQSLREMSEYFYLCNNGSVFL